MAHNPELPAIEYTGLTAPITTGTKARRHAVINPTYNNDGSLAIGFAACQAGVRRHTVGTRRRVIASKAKAPSVQTAPRACRNPGCQTLFRDAFNALIADALQVATAAPGPRYCAHNVNRLAETGALFDTPADVDRQNELIERLRESQYARDFAASIAA